VLKDNKGNTALYYAKRARRVKESGKIVELLKKAVSPGFHWR
jgi:hypothetical protein